MYAEDEAALLIEAAADDGALEELAERRVAGEPLEQLLGWAAFAGLRVRVAPGVFVPRRRTELLLGLALAAMTDGARMLELCCGAAPVATAVTTRMPRAEVSASDLDPGAVAIARANLEPLGGRVFTGDLFAPLPAGDRYEVIVANAPYVPSGELRNMPREAREHEHPLALDGGPDGLALHRRIAAGAAPRLAPGGVLLVETSRRQASLDRAVFESAGWSVELVEDEGLDATAVRAVRPDEAGR